TPAPGSFPTALRGQTVGTAFHAEEDSSNRAARLRLARSGRGQPSGLRIRVRGRPRRPELGVGVVVVALEPEDSSLPETPTLSVPSYGAIILGKKASTSCLLLQMPATGLGRCTRHSTSSVN